MARHLSISRAWDETKSLLAADGRLFASVALALVALPTGVAELVDPGMANEAAPGVGGGLMMLVASIVAIVGQLALIRLALGPSITVGGAIAHGLARTPVYVLALILVIVGIIVLAIPFLVLLVALGVSFEPGETVPPAAYLVLAVALLLILFLAVRMIMSSPVASAERAGPVQILKRSWQLTSGHWLRLFAFLLLIILTFGLAAGAISLATETFVRLLFGDMQPWSIGALIFAIVSALLNAFASTILAVMIARMYVQLAGAGGADVTVPSTGT